MRAYAHLLTDVALAGSGTIAAFVLRDASIDVIVGRNGLGLYLLLSIAAFAFCYLVSGTSNRIWRYVSFNDVIHIAIVTGIAILIAWAGAFLIDRAAAIPRSLPPIQWVMVTALLVSCRSMARVRSKLRVDTNGSKSDQDSVEHVLIVGMGDLAELYIRCAESQAPDTISIAGILAEEGRLQNRALKSVKVLGKPENIRDVVNTQAIHGIQVSRVVLTVPFSDLSDRALTALRDFEKISGMELDLFGHRLGFWRPEQTSTIDKPHEIVERGSDLMAEKSFYPIIKRAMDVFGALVLLGVLSPLILMVWLVVLVDVGSPAHFWQVRPGYRGRQFRVLKFRTMSGAHDADGKRIPDEQRSSRIGDVLRASRLDELPQLLNILFGDMSFIGPRPLLPVDQPQTMERRLSVRPGLTGWAQVNGGRLITPEDKAALDAWYVQNLSLRLDLEIFLKTVLFLIQGGDHPPDPKVLAEAKLSASGPAANTELN